MNEERQRWVSDPNLETEVFVEPSSEARRLTRRLGWLVAPEDGHGSRLSRVFGRLIVAPFTQLTFFSFELQAFLFIVFHRTLISRIGHFAFMIAVNFFVMAGLAQVRLGGLPHDYAAALVTPSLATAYATLLLLWYLLIAREARLWA